MTFKTMDKTQFNKALTTIGKTQDKLRALLHDCGMYAITQSIQHNNVTPALDLFNKMHESQRKEAMKAWLINFGNIKADAEKGLVFTKKKENDPAKLDELLEKADSIPYWELTREQAVEPGAYDLVKELYSVISRAKKYQENGKRPVVHAEFGDKIISLFGNDSTNAMIKDIDVSVDVEALAHRADAEETFMKLGALLGYEISLGAPAVAQVEEKKAA